MAQPRTENMSNLNFELPEHLQGLQSYSGISMDGKYFALYALSPVTAYNLQAICRVCDEEVDEEIRQMHPAPVPSNGCLIGKSLREVVDFHQKLISRDSDWDQNYLAIVTQDDWAKRGILIVSLSCGDDSRPDAFYVPAAEAGSSLINLQIGNTDWAETRYGYESYQHTSLSGNEVGDNEDSDSDGSKQSAGQHGQMKVHHNQNPCFLVCNAAYPPQSAHAVLDTLDPEWQKRHCKPDEHFIEGQIPWERAYKTHDGQIDTVWCDDAWSEAVAHHPAQCKQLTHMSWEGRTVVRKLDTRFFVYCDDAFARDGTVLLVKMDWDGDITANARELWDVAYLNDIDVETKRCRAEDAYEELIVLTNGSIAWRGVRAAYSHNRLEQPSRFLHWT